MMKKNILTKLAWGAFFIIFEIVILIASLAIEDPISIKISAFFTLNVIFLSVFFWLYSLIVSFFQKNNPNRWRDFFIVLLLNIFGAVYFWRARQIRNYKPLKDPETFNQKFSKWMNENHFSLEKCIEQRRKSARFTAVMLILHFVLLTVRLGLKYALFFAPEWLSPLVFIFLMLGFLFFLLRYVYRDWQRTDHIPFLLGVMFLQADAGSRAKGMMFIDKEGPSYKKPPLSFILMGDLFLFFSMTFGMGIFGFFSSEMTMMDIYLATGGVTLALMFLLIFLQFQTTWFVYFHPNSIFSVIKHYQAWKTASTILAILPILGFIAMFIIMSIPGVVN